MYYSEIYGNVLPGIGNSRLGFRSPQLVGLVSEHLRVNVSELTFHMLLLLFYVLYVEIDIYTVMYICCLFTRC